MTPEFVQLLFWYTLYVVVGLAWGRIATTQYMYSHPDASVPCVCGVYVFQACVWPAGMILMALAATKGRSR